MPTIIKVDNLNFINTASNRVLRCRYTDKNMILGIFNKEANMNKIGNASKNKTGSYGILVSKKSFLERTPAVELFFKKAEKEGFQSGFFEIIKFFVN